MSHLIHHFYPIIHASNNQSCTQRPVVLSVCTRALIIFMLIGLVRKSSTPLASAFLRASLLATPVRATIVHGVSLFFFSYSRIFAVAANPSMTGMERSIRIRKNLAGAAAYFSKAMRPFSALSCDESALRIKATKSWMRGPIVSKGPSDDVVFQRERTLMLISLSSTSRTALSSEFDFGTAPVIDRGNTGRDRGIESAKEGTAGVERTRDGGRGRGSTRGDSWCMVGSSSLDDESVAASNGGISGRCPFAHVGMRKNEVSADPSNSAWGSQRGVWD